MANRLYPAQWAALLLVAGAILGVVVHGVAPTDDVQWTTGALVFFFVCYFATMSMMQRSRSDGALAALLSRILAVDSRRRTSSAWLLPFRPIFRDVVRRRPVKSLLTFAEAKHGPAQRRLAIWLLGRCGGAFGSERLGELHRGEAFLIRRELVRAVKRKGAWAILREIEANDPDPRVREMAHQQEPSNFGNRMTRFLMQIPPRDASRARQTMFVRKYVDSRTGRPPKSASRIRRILEHIRFLVHGTSNG